MSTASNYTKYIFQDRAGGIVDPRVTPVAHSLFGIGHTAFISLLSNLCLHLHQASEEFYLLGHHVCRRLAPYEGFTIRVPVTSERDKVEDDV